MVAVRLEGISKAYGKVYAAREVDLSIQEGEFLTLLGASGSGKTTCLRIIGGFIEPTRGRVYFGDEDITRTPAHHRNTGMVFQQYALFPHLTVAQNVAFGLRVRRLSRAVIDARVNEALRLVRLSDFGDRYPAQLSGGQKQRVALARAVVINPRVLLLDEPLGALDLKLREELQAEIKRVQETLGITAVFVTHDQDEALAMSDRVAVMRDGKIAQIDTPAAIYSRPASRYVANFVGRTNFLPVTVTRAGGDHFTVSAGPATYLVSGRQGAGFEAGDRALLAFRPEEARIGEGGANRLSIRVDKLTFIGEGWVLAGTGPAGEDVVIRVPAGHALPAKGEVVPVTWTPERSLLLRDED